MSTKDKVTYYFGNGNLMTANLTDSYITVMAKDSKANQSSFGYANALDLYYLLYPEKCDKPKQKEHILKFRDYVEKLMRVEAKALQDRAEQAKKLLAK